MYGRNYQENLNGHRWPSDVTVPVQVCVLWEWTGPSRRSWPGADWEVAHCGGSNTVSSAASHPPLVCHWSGSHLRSATRTICWDTYRRSHKVCQSLKKLNNKVWKTMKINMKNVFMEIAYILYTHLYIYGWIDNIYACTYRKLCTNLDTHTQL